MNHLSAPLDPAWTAGPDLPAPAAGLGHLTAASAAVAPSAPALVARLDDGGTRTWTYRELDAEVDARARAMHARGLRRGDRALLVTTRVPALVPTVLALLRLGAAYVPVEAGAPDARWRTVASLAGATAIVGPTASVRRAAGVLGDGVLLLDATEPVPAAADDAPLPAVAGSDVAYVLFTSGSTGTPKGVVVSHDNVAHRLVSYVALTPGPVRYLLHSSLSFDGAVGGMFSTLARGGCLVLVPDAVAEDPGLAARVVREERVTHLEPVPSWYAALLDLAAPGDLDAVRVVILGGEVLPPELVAASHRRAPAAEVFNDYGPTEVTVAATVHPVPHGWTGQDVPIGRPHANTTVAVLDEDGRPVPAGRVGELWVGGPCVAQGYLGVPEHPSFRPLVAGGPAWYRTGDLVRWDDEGLLRFAGRRDRQVKIRGQRVEPEEVEAVLGGLPGVRAAAVTVDGAGADARLVAYVELSPAAARDGMDADAVAAGLARTLPRYLQPGAVVVVPRMPLTPGGKVDRRALPAPARGTGRHGPAGEAAGQAPGGRGPGEAPRDAAESTVAEAFADVLGTAVDRTTDFFAAGGQSLAAARVAARLRDRLGVDVTTRDLFALRTPAALAAGLAERPVVAAQEPLRRRSRDHGAVWEVPASPRQESFWYLEHVPGGAGRSNLVELLTFPPGTDPRVLRRAVDVLVERHAGLRTGFRLTTDGLQQVVRPRVAADVRDLPAAPDDAALLAQADRLGAVPFDLAGPSLLRAAVTDGPQGPVLVLVVHHAVADGWSLDVLVREVRDVVAAGGDASGLPDPAVEYVDLVEWTASRPAARRDAAVEHLTGLLLRAAETGDRSLPFDRPRAAQPDAGTGLLRTQVPAATLRRVTELARTLGSTVYAVLAASLGCALAGGSGLDEVVLGGPLSGRGDPALDRVVGCCINTGVFPVDTSGEPTFAEVVRRVTGEAADAAPHTWLPLEVPLRPLDEGARADALPVLLNLLEAGPAHAGGAPGGVARRSRPAAMAYAELDLYLEARDGALAVDAVHALARLDAGTVETVLARWFRLLDAALDDPDARVADLPLLAPEEVARLASLEGDPGPAPTTSVLDAARDHLHRDEAAPAVVDDTGVWSRRRLWDRSGAIAAHLAAGGARPGDRVVLAVDESSDAVAALLACWRVGAVPVPMGANQPARRVRAVADLCGAVAVVDPDALRPVPAAAGWDDVPSDPDRPAYVLFTSGSTGEPKGVVVSHGALGASTHARTVAYPDRPGTALVTHDLAFDAGLGIIAWYLTTGGTVVLATHEDRLDPDRLADLVDEHGVGQLDIVPSHYRLLLDVADPALLQPLRLVTLGGEACPPSLVAAHRSVVPGATLVNEYGPTESTVWALARVCTAEDATADRVTIGRPIHGVAARVADATARALPPGAEGELLLSGHLLADGYLDDAALTARRFVDVDGTRWYRTGDRARWTPSGEVDFLGRGDAQVKVRGFRVELGEVESALARLEGVVQCAAAVLELVPGSPALVAWVQLTPAAAADGAHGPDELRARLLTDLPDWLVPTTVVVVDAMPETTAGKVDRGRLPAPHGEPLAPTRRPGTPTEVAVAAIWEDLLGRPVPVDQSFLALGGQSLLTARMVARVRAELDAEIGLAEVLAAPRVRDIAALVDRHRGARSAAPAGESPLDLADVEDLLARIDELDDAQVARLLARMEQR